MIHLVAAFTKTFLSRVYTHERTTLHTDMIKYVTMYLNSTKETREDGKCPICSFQIQIGSLEDILR